MARPRHLQSRSPLRRHHTMTCTSPGLGRGYPPLCQPLCAWLTPMPHCAANSCSENNAAWGTTSGILWPRNQYPGPIIPSRASAVSFRGSAAWGSMSAEAPRWLGLGICRATAPYDVITRWPARRPPCPASSCTGAPQCTRPSMTGASLLHDKDGGTPSTMPRTVAGYRARTRHPY